MKNKTLVYFLFLLILAGCAGQGNRDQDAAPFSRLVWNDEFDYSWLPDTNRWSYDTLGNTSGWGNNEWQHYTASVVENAYVENGMLHIKAKHEKISGKDYSSARLVTRGKGDWLYGRVEVRAKLPATRGIWPAIWMLPTDWEYGDWPASGEIDIMEHVGYMPDSVFSSVHTEKYNHVIGTQKTRGIFLPDLHDDFHTYAMEWDSLEIRFFVDTLNFYSFKKESDDPAVWPFNKPFHLLLNVAVGGNWGAVEGVDETGFPQEMIVDYVRVYQ